MPPIDPLAPARRALRLTRAALVVERLVQALWLPVSVAALAFTAWAFDLHTLLPGDALIWVTGVVLLGVLAALVAGFWRFRWPTQAQAQARVDAHLPGRPLAALTDRQALGADDPASAALWQAHLARMSRAAAGARAQGPQPGLVQRDPYALRLIAATAAAMAVLFASGVQRGPLAGLPGAADAAIGASWEGWITPPAYTGRPGLYLNEIDREGFEVPQGSRVILRFYGPPGRFDVVQSLDDALRGDDSGQALELDARRSGRLEIDGPGGRAWDITVLPDALPTVTAQGLTRARGGVAELPFSAQDDHGVRFGQARITLDLSTVDSRHGRALAPEPREALVLTLPLPVTGSRTAFDEVLREDLSLHPFANLPVRVVLSVEDAAGQTGAAPELAAILPGRRFFDPAAQALIEVRQDLLWNTQNGRRAAMLMRAMIYEPGEAFRFEGAVDGIRGAFDVIEARLEAGDWTPEARDTVAQTLWDLALSMEEGELANARERLRRAQERLDQAMRDGASAEEIQELMDELREATRDYMDMLAEQAEPADQSGDQRDQGEEEGQRITQDQIQELMDEIQRLMEEGRMDEAADLMAQLNALLENLQMQRAEGGEGGEGDETMEGLGDTLSEQQDLADQTFEQLQEQFGDSPPRRDGQEGQEGNNGQGGSEPDKGDAEALAELAERQRALREQLRQQELGDLPGEDTAEGQAALDALEEAERQMAEAAEALEEGDARGALDRQAEALEALREGVRQLRDARDADLRERAEAEGQQGQATGQGRDPLGRDLGEGRDGQEFGSVVPGQDPRARARELLDEIRRRQAERERPEAERDYLDRLIERF